MVATGHTYDRVCIERWLAQGNRTCPVTGMRLRHLELTPNFALRNAIQVCSEGCSMSSEGGRAKRRQRAPLWQLCA
jgi:F-box/WD-40 domain protein 7